MATIGHNNPPKDREQTWKSISINVWEFKSLQECQDHIQTWRELYRDLGKKGSGKMISIPDTIGVLVADYWMNNICPDYDENGNSAIKKLLKQLKRESKAK